MTTVTIKDFRETLGWCRDARAWFWGRGLDPRQFVREGMPAEVFLNSGDARAERLVAAAVAREAAERGR